MDIVGSLGDLCKSAETLNSDYLQPNITKDTILKPKPEVSRSTNVKVPLLSSNDDHDRSEPTIRKFYGCPDSGTLYFSQSCRKYVSDGKGAVCPNCSKMMCVEFTHVVPKVSTKSDTSICESKSGYVKGLVTYMVTDNLEVKPLSTISVISVLNQFCVKDVSSLVEKDVHIGFDEGKALLKASLQTKAVLTSVFL